MNTIQQETCGVCGGAKGTVYLQVTQPIGQPVLIPRFCQCQHVPAHSYVPPLHPFDTRSPLSFNVTLDTVEQGNQDMMILWQDVQRENARLSARIAEREHLLGEARTLLRRDEVEMARFTHLWEEERDALLRRIEAVLKEKHD